MLVLLIEGFAFGLVIYWNCVTFEVGNDNIWAPLLITNILKFQDASLIWQKVDLITLVYLIREGLLIEEGLFCLMAPQTMPSNIELMIVFA